MHVWLYMQPGHMVKINSALGVPNGDLVQVAVCQYSHTENWVQICTALKQQGQATKVVCECDLIKPT